MMPSYIVDIRISADEFQKMYAGLATSVSARCRNGLRIQFPASALRPFVTVSGIEGSFILEVGDDAKLIQMRRLG